MWLFYLSKIIDLADTVSLVDSKKSKFVIIKILAVFRIT